MSAPRSKATKARKAAVKALDFDAVLAKKDRVLGKMPPVKIGGKNFLLPPTLPLAVTDRFADSSKVDEKGDVRVLLSDMSGILRDLFGDEQWNEIKRHIDISDLPDLFNLVFDRYGESLGEASASGES